MNGDFNYCLPINCRRTCRCPCTFRCLPGPPGPTGAQGVPGMDGKSAFQSAQEGGYTGTESEFYAALSNLSYAILSTAIRVNEVVTMAQYQALLALGEIDPNTAYDIIEDVI